MVGGRGGSSEVTLKLGLAGWVGVDEERGTAVSGSSTQQVGWGCSGPGRRLRLPRQVGQARVESQGRNLSVKGLL